MTISGKIQENAVFIEFLAGSGLAILFHLVLHKPDAAYSIFGIGILLSLGTYLLREDLERTRHGLTEQYHHAHEITFAMAGISEPECLLKAQDLLAGMIRTITQLQQGCIPLLETEFYMEGAKCADHTTKRILAVDPMTSGWNSRGALVNFYQANLRAVKRGVDISRIFIMNREELIHPDVQKVLLCQLHDGISVRVAFRDELPAGNGMGSRDATSSYDFAIFDGHTAAELLPQLGTYFGCKTADPYNVEKLQRMYDLIAHSAHTIVEENGEISLASTETLKAAA